MPGSVATCSTPGRGMRKRRSAPIHTICVGAGCIEAIGTVTGKPAPPGAGSLWPGMPGWRLRGSRRTRAGRLCNSTLGLANWIARRRRTCWSVWKTPETVTGRKPSACSWSRMIGPTYRLDGCHCSGRSGLGLRLGQHCQDQFQRPGSKKNPQRTIRVAIKRHKERSPALMMRTTHGFTRPLDALRAPLDHPALAHAGTAGRRLCHHRAARPVSQGQRRTQPDEGHALHAGPDGVHPGLAAPGHAPDPPCPRRSCPSHRPGRRAWRTWCTYCCT